MGEGWVGGGGGDLDLGGDLKAHRMSGWSTMASPAVSWAAPVPAVPAVAALTALGRCLGHAQLGTPPRPYPPVGPNLSHHKARVLAMGWTPVGDQKHRGNGFCCPFPPPPRKHPRRDR